MATKRGGLGRGIGALIPPAEGVEKSAVDVFFSPQDGATLSTVPGVRFAAVAVEDIVANPQQPRKEFRQEDLDELTHSVREFGVLQPIVVRPNADGAPGYQLIMGERRLRAARAAGLETIPAVVRETADENMLRDALLENLHRADLNALEEASAYQQLLDDFGITQQELADRLGRSRPQVTNTLRLMKLPARLQSQVAAGVLTAGHARAILSLDTEDAQLALAAQIVKKSLTVRQAEELAGSVKTPKSARAASRAGGRTDQLADLAERLGDRLNTKVNISLSKTKGTITIDFASVQDLNRILDEMGLDGFISDRL